ncbi:MAG: hypothetical protein ACI83P_000639 [Janthinobacterium sp.]|jgi:hypothetical protein
MPDHLTEKNPELTFFIVEGNYRVATIATNDYGFQLSAKMAQTYLAKARDMLGAKRTRNPQILTDIGKLKAAAAMLDDEYAQLDEFCSTCQRFNGLQTHCLSEWVSKWVVRAIARHHLGSTSYLLAYKIRAFHAMTCAVLVDT